MDVYILVMDQVVTFSLPRLRLKLPNFSTLAVAVVVVIFGRLTTAGDVCEY